jgi:hypothetical protein
MLGVVEERGYPTEERRWAPAARHLDTCRLCFGSIEWVADHLEHEYGDVHVFYRCPECGGSFPIRHSDAATMTGAASA